MAQQLLLAGVVHFADELHQRIGRDQLRDLLVVVGLIAAVDLGGHLEGQSQLAGDGDGAVEALFR